MIDRSINNLAMNQVDAVIYSCVIRKSASPKFIELCMEPPERKSCLVSKTLSNNSSFNLLESLAYQIGILLSHTLGDSSVF